MRIVAALDNVHAAIKDWKSYVTPRGGKVTIAPYSDTHDIIARIHVHRNQGQGIGTELLEMAKQHAIKNGRGLTLVPSADEKEDQEKLLGFYRNRGFTGPDEDGFMWWELGDSRSD